MTALSLLWLPVLLSAVLVFLASSVLHMVLPWHRGDYRKMPNEDAARDALRSAAIPPGQYMFPNAESMKEIGTPEMQQKLAQGPVGILIMRTNGMPNMGASLMQWFALCCVIGALVAYLAGLLLPPGAEYMQVFRVVSTAALLGYGFSTVNDSIWKGVTWNTTLRFFVDGLVYALLTAGAFAWLWPAAA